MNEQFEQSIVSILPKWIKSSVRVENELIFSVSPEHLVPLLFFLRNHTNTQFELLVDACGVDYPSRSLRFEMVYQLLSVQYNSRLRIKVAVDEFTPIPSATEIYPSAGWLEREAWDMYGIFFSNHPDLRRILTDYGFEGHPLRKDFPLTGYTEVRYDDSEKRVVIEPIQITQEYRYFNFLSPWDTHTRKS
jgi:NADH/F420H2 dehydrogenase subunit C